MTNHDHVYFEYGKMDPGFYTVLNVIENNFKAVNAKVFLIRVCYAGEHSFDKPEETLMSYFMNNVATVKSVYCDASVNGFLLIYQKYYVAVVEGSEESVSRQIRLFLAGAPRKFGFGRAKLLIAYHNIRERSLREDSCLFTTPSTLAAKMNAGAPMSYHFEVLETFLEKIDKLTALTAENKQVSFSTTSLKDTKTEYLPEYALLEYVLASPYITDLREYSNMYHTLPDYQFAFEKCWPAAFDFTPRIVEKKALEEVFVEPLPEEYDPDQEVEKEEDEEEEGEGGQPEAQ